MALFLACSILIFLAFYTLYDFTATLRSLDIIEAQRDQWQRPSDVVQALELRAGNTVADLGSGAGYFSLKLARVVGPNGRVLAVDLRRLSLFFLWTRALLKGHHNIRVIVGKDDDPRLPSDAVDAVLIANTYHELSHPDAMLDRIFQSLRPGGRLVVVDRAPRGAPEEGAHEVPLAVVEHALGLKGFDIVRTDDRFIDRAGEDLWWLIVARKPE